MTSRNIGTVLAALLLAVGISSASLAAGGGGGVAGPRPGPERVPAVPVPGPALVQAFLALGDQIRGPLAQIPISPIRPARPIRRLTRTTPHGHDVGIQVAQGVYRLPGMSMALMLA